MPSGIYERTEEFKEWLRNNMTDYNRKELGHAKIGGSHGGKITGKIYGPINIIKRNKSEIGREKSRLVGLKTGPTTGAKALIQYNKSEKGRAKSRKNGANIIAKIIKSTVCQTLLSKALSDNGIHNHMEHYFPEIRRLGDIAIPSSKLIIEVDGSSHNGGMWCTKEEKQADDKLKDEQIKSLGWNVIRFKNEEVETDLKNIIDKISLLTIC